MTDFVNRLLGRSGLPPIRPLLPSLFELFAPAGDEPPLPMGEITTNSPQATDRPAQTFPVASTVDAPPSEITIDGPQGTVLLAQMKPASPITDPAPLRPAPADPPVTHTTEIHQDVSVFHPVPRIEKITEAAPPPAIPASHPVSPPARTTPRTDPVPVAAPVQVVHPLTPQPTRPVVVPTAHPVQSPTSPVPPMPLLAPTAPPAARVEPPPSVRISIGRIEVKATADNAPAPKKEHRKQPVLSLDDYLRRHAGGGGR